MLQEFQFNSQVGNVQRRMVTEVAPNENTPEVLKGKLIEFDLPDSLRKCRAAFRCRRLISRLTFHCCRFRRIDPLHNLQRVQGRDGAQGHSRS